MDEKLLLSINIKPEQDGSYFTFSFNMPDNVEELSVSYSYDRYVEEESSRENGIFIARREVNIIDLGLLNPDGLQVGASGSDKNKVIISETRATPGYNPCRLYSGDWQIIVGAYKVALVGVTVTYEVGFIFKKRRLFKGDLHIHTIVSDGVLTVEELGQRAVRNGLDFFAVTDHNQPVAKKALPLIDGITIIPGMEWTNFKGHANFLGVDDPLDLPYFANTFEEVKIRFESAREKGAFIMINHPMDENHGFRFDINELPYDCYNVWSGPMRAQNFKSLDLWHNMLLKGKKIPICGGSDYHRDVPFLFPGAPANCVFAMSPSCDDILNALKKGNSYIIYAPDGPSLTIEAGGGIMGETVNWLLVKEMEIAAGDLIAGDIIKVITGSGEKIIFEATESGFFKTNYIMESPGFVRVEILRIFIPGIPPLPALISNPVYFDEK